MTARVLMIEDDQSLAAMVAEYLDSMGMKLTIRATAADGLKAVRQGGFEAVILDVMLPDLDGFEVCRRLRAESDVPILMLTARGEEMDRILGLAVR